MLALKCLPVYQLTIWPFDYLNSAVLAPFEIQSLDDSGLSTELGAQFAKAESDSVLQAALNAAVRFSKFAAHHFFIKQFELQRGSRDTTDQQLLRETRLPADLRDEFGLDPAQEFALTRPAVDAVSQCAVTECFARGA